MRIEGSTTALRQALLAAAPSAGEAFRIATTGDAAIAPAPLAPPTAAQAVPATSMQMLVALASIDPAVERRRKAAADADRGLGMLERLDATLAAGETPDAAQIAALADWTHGFAIPDDPALAPLAREIDLRVRVELAKYDRRV